MKKVITKGRMALLKEAGEMFNETGCGSKCPLKG
jgi:hypothetical protein